MTNDEVNMHSPPGKGNGAQPRRSAATEVQLSLEGSHVVSCQSREPSTLIWIQSDGTLGPRLEEIANQNGNPPREEQCP
jgi:hypothetical protein